MRDVTFKNAKLHFLDRSGMRNVTREDAKYHLRSRNICQEGFCFCQRFFAAFLRCWILFSLRHAAMARE